MRWLAAHVDRLVAFSSSQPHEVAVLTASVEEVVATIKQQQKQKGKFQKKKKQQQAKSGKDDPTPLNLVAQAAGMSFFNWVFEGEASECCAPCNWQGMDNL